MKTHDLDTPALLLDMEAMESNLSRMANYFRGASARLRPHFKNHRMLPWATRQIEAGAIGMTCARLSQAEALVQHGIQSVLIANEIVGESRLRQFAELARRAEVIVPVDNAAVVNDMARVSRDLQVPLNVLVDVDTGLKRCGVPSREAALELARRVVNSGLRLRGVMGYEGHLQPRPPGEEKIRAVQSAVGFLVEVKQMIEKAGLPGEIVSCGGTGTYSILGSYPGVTEIQAGSYLIMDTWYSPVVPDFKLAASVLVTIISKTGNERFVVDAGVKALSGERGLPSVKGISGLELKALHAEHGIIAIQDPAVQLNVGDKIELWVHYHDGTIHLHNKAYGIRNGEVEEVLTIEH